MNLRRAAAWGIGAVVSVGLNIGGLTALALVLHPQATPDHPLPKSRLSIQTQDVPRSEAPQTDGAGEALESSPPNSPRARQGVVQQSYAQPSRVSFGKLGATSAKPTRLTPQNRAAVTRATVPSPSAVKPVQPQAAQRPLIPKASKLATAPVPVKRLPAVTKMPVKLQITRPETPTNTPLPLPSQKQTAALAWSGDTQNTLAQTSLAAIQAFMREGDLKQSDSNITDVRDGIAGILASVPCARLQTTFVPETGALELRGHIPEDAVRTPLLAALSDQIGKAIPISDQLLILPPPQCGALAGIAAVGLPQSTEQLTNPRVIGADGFARSYTYTDGARLSLDLVAPDYDSYVYVDYFTADGNVIHLQPNQIVPLEFAPAKSDLSVGKERSNAPSLDITVSAPFGQEIAAAFASSTPLYDGTRPLQEPAAPYLAFLAKQVKQARATQPDFKGEWVYFFITTKAR